MRAVMVDGLVPILGERVSRGSIYESDKIAVRRDEREGDGLWGLNQGSTNKFWFSK